MNLSNEILLKIMKSASVGIFEIDIEADLIIADNVYASSLGYSKDELSSFDTWKSLIRSDYRDSVKNDFRTVLLQKNESVTSIYALRKKNGDYIWSKSTIFMTDYGKIIGSHIDITQSYKDHHQYQIIQKEIAVDDKHLENVIEKTKLGMWEYDLQNDEAIINRYCAEMLGYTLEELSPIKADGWFNLIHPEDIERVKEVFNAYTKRKVDSYSVEYRLRHKEDYWVWFLDSSRVAKKYDNRPTLIYGILIEINDIKRYEEKLIKEKEKAENITLELKESQLILKKAQQLGDLGSWKWSIEDNKVYWSDEYYRILGLTHDKFEVSYDAYLEFIHPDDRDYFMAATKNALTKGEPWNIEYRIIRADNVIRMINEIGEVEVDVSGKPISLFGCNQDITERKELEFELISAKEKSEESEQRLRLATDSAKIGIWDWDIISNTAFWDERSYELYGRKKEEIDKITYEFWISTLHPDDVENTISDLTNALEGQDVYETTFRVVQPSGKLVHIATRGVIIRDKKGSPLRIIGIVLDITEEKNREIELIKAKEKAETNQVLLKKIAENFPNSYLSIIEKDFTIGFTSGQEFINQGINPDDFIGLKLEQVFGEFSGKIIEEYQKTFDGEENQFELFLNDQYQLYKTVPLYNEKREISQILAVAENITERKQREIEISLGKKRLDNIIEGAKLGTWELDLNTETVLLNKHLTNILGYSVKELKSIDPDKWYSLSHPEDREKVDQAFYAHINGETESFEAEYRMKHKKGYWVWVLDSGKIIAKDNHNQPILISGVQYNISERKKREEELTKAKAKAEESENKIRSFIEQSPIAIFTTDLEGRYTYTNQKWMNISGMSIGEYEGEGWVNAIHSDDRHYVTSSWNEFIRTGNKWALEYRIIDKGGNITWVASEAHGLFVAKKKIGYTGSSYNITERKLAEKAIMENQRISIIAEMASAVAHDFNNSLQAMINIVEILSFQPSISEKSLEYINRLKKIIKNTGQRVRVLQKFGNSESSEQEYTKIDINFQLQSLISNSKHLWKNHNQGNTVKIVSELNTIPVINGIEGEINAVLLNIIKNSFEAMPEGGIITIKTLQSSKNIIISIKDTGIGMDKETQAKIFQPFFTTKGFDLGRGLGMSGAFNIIKEHGGNIYVKASELGKGTTLEIILPITEVD